MTVVLVDKWNNKPTKNTHVFTLVWIYLHFTDLFAKMLLHFFFCQRCRFGIIKAWTQILLLFVFLTVSVFLFVNHRQNYYKWRVNKFCLNASSYLILYKCILKWICSFLSTFQKSVCSFILLLLLLFITLYLDSY